VRRSRKRGGASFIHGKSFRGAYDRREKNRDLAATAHVYFHFRSALWVDVDPPGRADARVRSPRVAFDLPRLGRGNESFPWEVFVPERASRQACAGAWPSVKWCARAGATPLATILLGCRTRCLDDDGRREV
jgi:hypothetical protein